MMRRARGGRPLPPCGGGPGWGVCPKPEWFPPLPQPCPHRGGGSRRRFVALIRFAARDLRGGFTGLRIFLACIAIGVGAIVAVNSLSHSLEDGLARDGRVILGGDASFSLIHRELSPEEESFLASRGNLNEVAMTRAMARNAAGDATLIDLKAVERGWPALGTAEFEPPLAAADIFAVQDGVFGAAVDDALLERLHLKVGDPLEIANLKLTIRARIVSEPDRLANGSAFPPASSFRSTPYAPAALLSPARLIRWTTRVVMGATPPSEAAVDSLLAEAKQKFPEAGWEARVRINVSPEFERDLDRFGEFLGAGGVGFAGRRRRRRRQRRGRLRRTQARLAGDPQGDRGERGRESSRWR